MNDFWWTMFFWTGICMYAFYKWDTRKIVKKRKIKK